MTTFRNGKISKDNIVRADGFTDRERANEFDLGNKPVGSDPSAKLTFPDPIVALEPLPIPMKVNAWLPTLQSATSPPKVKRPCAAQSFPATTTMLSFCMYALTFPNSSRSLYST